MLMRLVDRLKLDIVAIDIAEAKFDVCIRKGDNRHKAQFPTSGAGHEQLRRWLKKHEVEHPHIWVESTGRYYEDLAQWAVKLGWKVTVANARAVRHFAISKLQMAKTDPLDALVILRFAECSTNDEFRFWKPKSRALLELRDLQLEIKGLEKAIGQERCRLKCRLKSEVVKRSIQGTILRLQAEVKKLRKESLRVIRGDEELRQLYCWLISIKGLGEITVPFLIAKIDFSAFRKGRQLVKYAGLDAVPWQSGKLKKRDRISRVGHADIRAAMYWPAVVAMTHDPDTKAFAEKIAGNNKSRMVAICAVMCRLLRMAFARVRDGQRQLAIQSA